MKIAFVIYENMTLLDFAGAYDPITRLKSMGFIGDLSYDICARTERVRSSEGAVLVAGQVQNDLSAYDYVIVPGGDGIKDLMKDPEFLRWIAVPSDTTVVAAVCGGSLLLGAAGLLRTRKATTHPTLMPVLEHFAGEVLTDRIVDTGYIITAGGVTAAIDLGLYVCEKIAGPDARRKIQVQMDYKGYPLA
jgi:transcriptional regulator GlxA family with amidase domain